MNQIQFETSKVFGVFVKLPDGAQTPRLWNLHNEPPYLTYQYGLALKRTPVDLIGTDLHNLGFVSNLTDEQKEGVVDISVNDPEYVFNYKSGWFEEGLSYSESFASLLTSLGIDENDNPILLTCNK